MNDAGHLNESRIQLAYLYSSAGIYLEAANMLKLVDTTALDRRQLVDYYMSPATNSTTNSSSTPTTRRRDTNRGGLR